MPPDAAPTLGQFIDGWELFRDPAIAGALGGALLGALGVYVVVRRMVFLSAALAQAAGLGVALSFYAQIHWGAPAALASPTVGAGLTSAIAAASMLAGQSGVRARRDGLLGLVYLFGAAGTLAVGTRIVQEVQDIESILFGSAVAVAPDDLRTLAWMAGIILVVHFAGVRGFVQVAIDESGARVRGLPVRLLGIVLVGSLAAAVSVCTRILGALPVFAFTVLPALGALRLGANVTQATVWAALLGALAGFSGYVAAFLWKLPVGAAQALVAAVLVGVAAVVGLLLDRLHHARKHAKVHVHGPGCGHVAVRHGDHVDYLNAGALEHPEGLGGAVHALGDGCGGADHDRDDGHGCGAHGPADHAPGHSHGPGCGHPPIRHGDHTDYVVDGALHHPHGEHCDHHGRIEVVK